ncbi:FGGY-family carbohydrate kinase [Oxalobacter sp. OttesenSCG-928-P03]|nr:FGGY-family carbohydrate kinase [Oxalobacter sp. OttesenSCG-928-P03]
MILVINLGLKSIRAIVFSMDGKKISSASKPVHTRLAGDFVEQSALEWKEKLFEVGQEAVDKAEAASVVRYVTVSCSASCLLPIDENMEPLAHAIMVSDRRAMNQAEEIAILSEFNELALKYSYSVSGYSQFARILWFKQNSPELFQKTKMFVAPNDYLLGILTGGTIVTDILNAEKLYYDSENNCYPEAICDRLGISTSLLPECVDIGTSIGRMEKKVATKLGLANAPEVIVGTYDAICSVFGTGVCDPGMVCDVSGTVTSIRMYTNTPAKNFDGKIFSQYFPPSQGYLIGGSNNLGGGLIEWAKQVFYSEVANPYELMQTECQSLAKGGGVQHSGLIFIPHLLGSRAPEWNLDARGAFFGLERHHTRKDLMRAIFESIGFSVRDFLEVFREGATLPAMVTASGGLARMSIANELKATITGLPYHLMDEFESTSLGAAIIVLCSTGYFSSYSEACDEMTLTTQIFIPRRQDRAYYDDMYGLYRKVNQALGPLFEERKSIVANHGDNIVKYIKNL